jgi:transcriptional regulator with XRE-family HTH domain
MSYGYSVRVVEAIKNADANLLGVQLGHACLARDISVSAAARALGVSRMTIYHWFLGRVEPKEETARVICSFLKNLD